MPAARPASALERLGWSHYGVGFGLWIAGRLGEAERAFASALELGERIEELRLTILMGIGRAMALADLGKSESARAEIKRWSQRADELGLTYHRVEARRGLAHVHLRVGDAAAAVDVAREWEEILHGTDEVANPVCSAPLFAEAYLLAGELDDASRLIEAQIVRTRDAGAPHYQGIAHRVRGRLHLETGRQDEARADFDFSVELLTANESAVELGRTLSARGDYYRDAGDAARATEDLKTAASLFEQCGAVAERALVTRTLSSVGVMPG